MRSQKLLSHKVIKSFPKMEKQIFNQIKQYVPKTTKIKHKMIIKRNLSKVKYKHPLPIS